MVELDPTNLTESPVMERGVVFHLAMSVGHNFSLFENGYSVSGGQEEEAKGCVDAKLAGMPVVWSGG